MLLIFVFLDNYVHRLVASKTDGKIVQYECEGDTCDAEKIDALQLEVNISSGCSFIALTHTGMIWSVICAHSTRTCSQVNWSLKGFTGKIRSLTWRRKLPRRYEGSTVFVALLLQHSANVISCWLCPSRWTTWRLNLRRPWSAATTWSNASQK